MGGPLAAEVDAKLRDTYGLSNTHLFYVAESAHKFVKTFLSGLDRYTLRPSPSKSTFHTFFSLLTHLLRPRVVHSNSDVVKPLNCTALPWDYKLEFLKTQAAPGEKGGPSCTCSSYYLASEENLDALIDLYFNHFMPDDDSLKVPYLATR